MMGSGGDSCVAQALPYGILYPWSVWSRERGVLPAEGPRSTLVLVHILHKLGYTPDADVGSPPVHGAGHLCLHRGAASSNRPVIKGLREPGVDTPRIKPRQACGSGG